MLVAQNSLGPVCSLPLTVRGSQRETYERVQTNLNDNLKEPGKEADFLSTLLNRIFVVMIVGALLSLWLSSST